MSACGKYSLLRCRSLVLTGAALAAVVAGSAPAAEGGTDALREEIRQLRARVEALEQAAKGRVSSFRDPTVNSERALDPGSAGEAVRESSPGAAAPAEPAPGYAADRPPAANSVAGLREQWRKLRRGMQSDAVLAMLGKPTRETSLNGKRMWYYSYPGVGAGSVFFNRDGGVSSIYAPSTWQF